MKTKLLFALAAVVCAANAWCQQSTPADYLLAAKITRLFPKLGLPVDSAASYLTGVAQFRQTQETGTDVFFSSADNKVVLDLKKNETGQVQVIICDMPDNMLSTAQKVISLMGMI